MSKMDIKPLVNLLAQHNGGTDDLQAWKDAEQLRRIAMTLHRWHELECGVDAGAIERDERWAIERAAWPAADKLRWWNGEKWVRKSERRTYADSEKLAIGARYPQNSFPADGAWRDTGSSVWWYDSNSGRKTHTIPDRESGALKRLARILKGYPDLVPYVQGDPRGASLYILRKSDIPAGASVDLCYSRGVAVYK